MDELQFSTGVVSNLVGASKRQLDHWTSTGLLRPSGKDAEGRGTRRKYTFQDVVALKAISALRARQCPLQKIRKAVRHLRSNYSDATNNQLLSRMTLLTDGKDVYILTDETQVMDIVTRQHVWSVAIGLIILEAREQVSKLPAQWDEPVTIAGQQYRLRLVRDVESGTYTAQCLELPAAISEGPTVKAAIANGKDAIRTVKDFMARRKRAGRNVQAG